MLYLAGLSIAGFLFFLIVFKKGKSNADYILLSWIFILAVHLVLFYLHYTTRSYAYPFTLGLILPIPVLHGVFLYIYAAELTGRRLLNIRSLFLHLLPFLLLVVLSIPFWLLPDHEKLAVFQNEGAGFEWYSLFQLSLIVLSGFGYSIATIRLIRAHRSAVLKLYSNVDEKMLNWLSYLAIGLAVIWSLAIFFDDHIVFGGVVLFVLFIGFFGVNQVPIFRSESTMESKASTPKYAKTGLKQDDAQQLLARLNDVMKADKPYKNPELTLADLASQLAVSPHQLSQVINSETGQTFYHFVNNHRVDEFVRIAVLPENRKYTYLALAYGCGFNSKTTFNKHFKLRTDKTPSEYFGKDSEEIGTTL